VRILERLGYRVELAHDGEEALSAAAAKPYAAILMDVQMPKMDGLEATREIRARERAAESRGGGRVRRLPPIVAMTANAMESDRQACLDAGMDDHLAKPVKAAEVAETLARWTEGWADDGEPEGPFDADGDAIPKEAPTTTPADDHRTGPPLDGDALASLRELSDAGEPGMFEELVELFVEDAEPRLEALREAIAARDAATIWETAHAIKGSAGSMGARRMSALASELQAAGTSGDLSGAAALLWRLEEEYGRVRRALEELVADGEGG
jgi:CheY-like chemotaxis protein